MICRSCNKIIPDGRNFCPYCGSRIINLQGSDETERDMVSNDHEAKTIINANEQKANERKIDHSPGIVDNSVKYQGSKDISKYVAAISVLATLLCCALFVIIYQNTKKNVTTTDTNTVEAEISKEDATIKDVEENVSITEETSNETLSYRDITGMDSISGALIFHCIIEELPSWNSSSINEKDFWNIMCYYANAEDRINGLNPPRTGEYGEFMVLPNSILINAGYACFPDFNGVLPEYGTLGEQVRYVDQNNTGVGIGDSIQVERISSSENEDNSIDVIYAYHDWDNTIEYNVHMVENPNYNRANDYFTYYYTIEKVEQKTQTELNSSTTNEINSPFYGIWCGASKDEVGAEKIASELRDNGFAAEIFITTEWSNLNTERWYVITAGTYNSREEAEHILPSVNNYYENAYIKYSGEKIN